MNTVLDFFKKMVMVVKWTLVYFVVLWAILYYVFNFDIFLRIHWLKFCHTHLHGFTGLVLALVVYTAIPIYLATSMIIYRTQEPLITIPLLTKIKQYITKMFTVQQTVAEQETKSETTQEQSTEIQYPENLPNELKVPFAMVKERILAGSASQFTYQKSDSINKNDQQEPEQTEFPIPTDFDIGDSLPDSSVPTFTDINFDEPTQDNSTKSEQENSVTKYFDKNNIKYEIFDKFIMTNKYIIYTHDDPDFWIMDTETWFAAGKQMDSPIPALLEMSKNKSLIPVVYLESTNIMGIDETIQQMTDIGIKVITDLSELD